MQDKYILATTGILCIAIMETAAILTGVNGSLMSICVGAIAAIIGGVVGFSINLTKSK